jgi:GntR family transcriptional regulator
LSVSEGRPAKPLAELAGVSPSSRWLQIEGLRRVRAQVQPIAHGRVLIHEEFGALLDEFRKTDGPFYDVIERRTGRMVANVVQSITGGPMEQHTAQLLGEEIRTTVIRVIRRYQDRSGALLLVSVNDHPAHRFRYEMQLQREG